MNTNAQTTNPPALVIDGIIIPVRIDPVHEYTLPTTEVAAGYGVTKDTLKKTLRRHSDELTEGKHWVSEVGTNCPHPGNNEHGIRHWTKRGIIRLGFFIKSERAKRFRDMAEDLVLDRWENPTAPSLDLTPLLEVLRDIVTEVREIRLALVSQSPAPAAGEALHLPAQITPDDRDICQLIRWMVYYKLPACSFSEIAGFAQTMGLFGGRLDGRRDDEGRLECTARSRSAFGWILSRHKDCAYILEDGGAAALRIYGHGRGRRYHVERLDGVATRAQ